MKKYLIITLAMFLTTAQAFAQEGDYSRATSTPEGRPERRQIMQDAVRAREEIRNEATSSREEMRNAYEQQREAIRQRMEQARKDTEALRESFRKNMEMKREDAKKQIEANRALLQQKLKNIKDERKKETVQTIDKRFEEINTDRLDHFSNVLDQIEKVMQNVESRTAKVASTGANVSLVNADIAAVKTAIVAARAAIVTQSGKTYPLTINQENTLRTDIGKTRQALATDLKSVQDKVLAAREALRKAATDLAQIPGVDTVGAQTQTATTTGTSTNQ